MSTVGNSSTPNVGWAWYGLNVQNQIWSNFTMPTPGGWISQLFCYYDTNSGTATTYVALWAGGAVVATLAIANTPAGSHSAGGQSWHGGAIHAPVYVKGGTAISIGAWSPQANGIVFSAASGGSSSSNTSAGGPGGQGGSGSTGIGELGAYALYTPNLRKVRRSGVWVEDPRYIRRSGVWVPATPRYIRRGGVWKQVQ